jgi:hypothetical protein
MRIGGNPPVGPVDLNRAYSPKPQAEVDLNANFRLESTFTPQPAAPETAKPATEAAAVVVPEQAPAEAPAPKPAAEKPPAALFMDLAEPFLPLGNHDWGLEKKEAYKPLALEAPADLDFHWPLPDKGKPFKDLLADAVKEKPWPDIDTGRHKKMFLFDHAIDMHEMADRVIHPPNAALAKEVNEARNRFAKEMADIGARHGVGALGAGLGAGMAAMVGGLAAGALGPPGLGGLLLSAMNFGNLMDGLDRAGRHEAGPKIDLAKGKPVADEVLKPQGPVLKMFEAALKDNPVENNVLRHAMQGALDKAQADLQAKTEKLKGLSKQLATTAPEQVPGICKTLEAALLDPEATVLKKTHLGGGINSTYIVHLSNGARAVFKPTAGEDQSKLRKQCEEDHQGKREQAAYIVDKAMGHLGRVPPTVRRTIVDQDGKAEEGALLYFIPNAKTAKISTGRRDISGDPKNPGYHRMAVLDNVIGNLDRHGGNWMMTEGKDALPIDHGLSFPHQNKEQGYINFDFKQPVELHDQDRQGLENLVAQEQSIRAELSPLLEPVAVDSMYERVGKMRTEGTTSGWWRE